MKPKKPPFPSHPVSYTARIVAAKRALEQLNPAPLFDDPYSARLAGDEVNTLLKRWQEVAKNQGIPLQQVIAKRTRYIAIRTRFMDDVLKSVLSENKYRQVVILGAGLDTRVFRFSWPLGTNVYEVDCPEILHEKMLVLRNIPPASNYQPVPGDLAMSGSQWATSILNAGYQIAMPTIWLMEGVVMYLKEKEVHSLLHTLSQLSVVGSILAMDGVKAGSVVAGQRARKADRGRVIRHWQYGCDNPLQLLANYGWTAAVSEPKDIFDGYGRYPESMPIGTIPEGQDEGRGVWLLDAFKE